LVLLASSHMLSLSSSLLSTGTFQAGHSKLGLSGVLKAPHLLARHDKLATIVETEDDEVEIAVVLTGDGLRLGWEGFGALEGCVNVGFRRQIDNFGPFHVHSPKRATSSSKFFLAVFSIWLTSERFGISRLKTVIAKRQADHPFLDHKVDDDPDPAEAP
jgi:hypothetical protein